MVEEVEAKAAQQDGLARAYDGQVDVGRVGGRDVVQAVAARVGGEAAVGGVRGRREVALRQDDGRKGGQGTAVVEGEGLVAVGRVVEADRAGRVRLHVDGVGATRTVRANTHSR